MVEPSDGSRIWLRSAGGPEEGALSGGSGMSPYFFFLINNLISLFLPSSGYFDTVRC